MKKYLLFILLAFIPCFVYAQFDVVSTQPANNAKSVPLTTTISVTFSEALDTAALNQYREQAWYANLDSVLSRGYSADMKTTFANVVLAPNHSYFLAFTYVKALSGAIISTPYVFYFTTGADFSPYSVSGNVFSGSTGVTAENAIVALSVNSVIKSDRPQFVAWANVNSNGSYTLPNIPNGMYWPIAAKDVDNNGQIDPTDGIDVLAIGDSVVVAGASLTNIGLTFLRIGPSTFHQAVTIADSLSKTLPSDKVLKQITSWNVDSSGKSTNWEFSYSVNGNTSGQTIHVNPYVSSVEITNQGNFNGIKYLRTLSNPSLAAASATIIANVENAGGRQFRAKPHLVTVQFEASMTLGDQTNNQYSMLVPDFSQNYWGVTYAFGYNVNDTTWQELESRYFLCNFTSGAIIASTSVAPSTGDQPKSFALYQNYPNPSNPSTTISYTIPSRSYVTISVFNTLGQKVAELVNGDKAAGTYAVRFDAAGLASGVYLYRIQAGSFVQTKKLVIMK